MKKRALLRMLFIAVSVASALSLVGCGGNKNENAGANNNAAVVTSTPATASVSEDTALKNKVEANLTKYGVSGVTVTVSGGEVTLSGNIARAKLQDAMKAANEANPKKVNNQMNIQ
jgi:osmotically-inducible protein OsmY